jgi:adenylosuccinate lyase
MNTMDFSTYISPLSWRYGSSEMKEIFSEHNKYRIWRKIWVALARAQHEAGLVTKQELEDLVRHENDFDIPEILTIEKETKHDVVAAIREFANKASIGGGKIHLGATSMDIVDNADALRIQEAISEIRNKLISLLKLFTVHIRKYAKTPCMGYTHLQPAEPTTVGYRLSMYAQDLLTDLSFLQFAQSTFKGKGMKGAVGSSASYEEVLVGSKMTAEKLDERVMDILGINASLISSQVYPRKFDYLVVSALSSIASSLAKFAGDVRILQSAGIGEWSEPFGKKQVGSSAMPFKKNPINCEKICSLARYILALPAVTLENATVNYLERTLDDSANKRIVIAEAFLALDEVLITAESIVSGLVINTQRIAFNVNQYAPFAATESILIALVKKGANRQEMHELLRNISMKSWSAVAGGKTNPMAKLLMENAVINNYLKNEEISRCLDVAHHIGNAPKRAFRLASQITKITKKYE